MPVNSIPLIPASPTPDYKPLPDLLRAGGSSVQGLYIHIPFCTCKCDYCDFYSLAGHQDHYIRYIDALQRQMRLETAFFGPIAPDTIFIGGGTPTLLPPPDLRRLFRHLSQFVALGPSTEFTVESNPNTFDGDRAGILAQAGVNRISFGAQSFQTGELAALNRDHDPDSVPLAVKTARSAGITNINIDLIYAIPGQTLESLGENLDRALALESDHLSCYGLMYESNTPMTARLKRGQVDAVDEELELEMMHLVTERLRAAGFERYEISNWAKPGRACRHNLHYWQADDHLAWGASAAAHLGGVRWKYVSSLYRYCDALERDALPVVEIEQLSTMRRQAEQAVLRLRLSAGLDVKILQSQIGPAAAEKLANVIQKYQRMGLLTGSPPSGALALTDAGIPVSDTIFADVFAVLDEDVGGWKDETSTAV